MKRTLLVLPFVLAACDGGLTGPAKNLVPTVPSLSASGAQQQVTGHADVLLPSFANAEEKYSNSAIRHADGTVSGEFELKSAQSGGLRIHGDVVCFTIVGNQARLGGLIDQSTIPSYEGLYVIWTVVDNGEGRNDPPDQTSDFIGPVSAATAATHCATGRNVGPFLPVLRGNLQVHG